MMQKDFFGSDIFSYLSKTLLVCQNNTYSEILVTFNMNHKLMTTFMSKTQTYYIFASSTLQAPSLKLFKAIEH